MKSADTTVRRDMSPGFAVARRRPQGRSLERPGKHHSTNVVDEGHDSDDQEVYNIFSLLSRSTEPMYVTVPNKDVQLQLEVNTGSSVSVTSETAATQRLAGGSASSTTAKQSSHNHIYEGAHTSQ